MKLNVYAPCYSDPTPASASPSTPAKAATARPSGVLSEDIQSSPVRHGVKSILTACLSEEEEEHALDVTIECMQLLEAINSLHRKHNSLKKLKSYAESKIFISMLLM